MTKSTRVRAIAAAAVVTLLMSACGSSPTAGEVEPGDGGKGTDQTSTYEGYAKLTGEARQAELVKAAEGEGELSIYTSWNYMDALVDVFSDKYDVNVSVYRANSETVLQRALQEFKAGFPGSDVFETNQMEMAAASHEGLFGPYASEYRDNVREIGRFDDWTAIRYNAFMPQWNTDKVKPGEEPTSFEDMADPKWRGRLSMEIGDSAWLQALYYYFHDKGMSDEDFRTMFTAVAANSQVVKGHTVWSELVSAGQHDVAVSQYLQVIHKSQEAGAHVAWKPASGAPVQPIVMQANGMGVMKYAEHPAAATLFLDFALSDEGQQIIESEQLLAAREPANDPLAGLELLPLDNDKLLSENNVWSERYRKLIAHEADWW